MKTMLCYREEEVVTGVIRENIDGPLSGHMASCESCRMAAKVTFLLQGDRRNQEIDVRSSHRIWTRATLLVQARRRRVQTLGWIVGLVSGALAGYLTSLLVLPSGTKASIDRTAVLLSHSLGLLLPTVVILAVVALIVHSGSHPRLLKNTE